MGWDFLVHQLKLISHNLKFFAFAFYKPDKQKTISHPEKNPVMAQSLSLAHHISECLIFLPYLHSCQKYPLYLSKPDFVSNTW